jgi:hypothetical protein
MNLNLNRYSNTILPERSRYQLRHFIIGQHDTAPMQWRQILLEAQDLSYKIRMAELDCERKRIEIHKLLSTGDPLDAIEAEEKQLGITLTERILQGAHLELSWLQELAEEVGSYSHDEIEADQHNYWTLRLNRQAGIDQLASQQGIGSANLQSMLSAGLLNREETPCAISPGT